MDARLDEIHKAVENINRNLVLLLPDVGKDYIEDGLKAMRDFEELDLRVIRRVLEDSSFTTREKSPGAA